MSAVWSQVEEALVAPPGSSSSSSSGRGRGRGRGSAVTLELALAPMLGQAWQGLVEERRAGWLQGHALWDATTLEKESPDLQLLSRKPTIPDNAQPLTERQLLSVSPRGTPLNQVTQVSVSGCRAPLLLRPLLSLPRLRSLALNRCLATPLTGLSGHTRLQEITAQSNGLEGAWLGRLPGLAFLDLSHNRLPSLSSLSGLQHCPALLRLELGHNRITRITGLKGCGRVQRICLDGNLLINSLGLQELGSVQEVSLRENHLPRAEGLDSAVLLRRLHLQQNNLQQVPLLCNHVLLRELDLSENALDSIAPLTSGCWLPLLQRLNLACNCLTALEPLVCMLSLEELDISNNAVMDFPLLLQCLKGCYRLKKITVHGNPVVTSKNFKSVLVKALPSLCAIDDEAVGGARGRGKGPPSHLLVDLCRRQLMEQDSLEKKHSTQLEAAQEGGVAVDELLRLQVRQCERFQCLLVQHLREHEYLGSSLPEQLAEEDARLRQLEAVLTIQRLWRAELERRRTRMSSPQWMAALTIQNLWRGYSVRKKLWQQLPWLQRRANELATRHGAATTIQSHFRGFLLRNRLRLALETIQSELLEEEFEEVTLDDYPPDLDEMRPLDTPIDPTPLPVDPTPSLAPQFVKDSPPEPGPAPPTVLQYGLPGCADEEVEYRQWDSRQLDRNLATVVLGNRPTPPDSAGTFQPRPPSPTATEPRPPASSTATEPRPPPSPVENSWGLSSSATLELMRKRAQRHRNQEKKAAQKNKMAADPSARLAAFQKQSRAAPVVHPSRRTGPRRVLLPLGAESTKSTPSPDPEEQTNKQDYMREWVERQRVARGNQVDRMWSSQPPSKLLPRMEPHVLAGHRARVVTVGVQNEVVEGGRAVRRSQVFKPPKQGKVGPGAWAGDGTTSTSHSSLTDCRPLSCRTGTYSKSSPSIPH